MDYQRKMEELVFAIKEAKKRNCNINLLIGAGCSVTGGVPLANTIVEDLKEKYPYEMYRVKEQTYGEYMSKLTHIERRLFIADYVKKSKVNWAHICIASLMKEKYINRVLTTNFDNILPRACAMVGEFPGIYDLALTKTTTFRSDLLLDNSIIYAHGQYSGFILCNTSDEVKEQKENIEPIFKQLNENSLWIVVGYSGTNDAIFQLFTEVKSFENRLYWVGYKNRQPSDLVKEQLLSSQNYAFYIKDYDSDTFFIELAKRFGLFPPKFIDKPFTYIKELFGSIDEESPIKINRISNEENLLTNTLEIIDKGINEIENDVKIKATLYVKNLSYYVDEFMELVNVSSDKLEEIMDILQETLDNNIDISYAQLQEDIVKIEKIISIDDSDISIIQLTISILQNIYICMIRQIDDKTEYYLNISEKYFKISDSIDFNNIKLMKSIAKIYNKFYEISDNKNNNNNYLIESLNFYIKVLGIEFDKESIKLTIKVIQNICESCLSKEVKLEKIEYVINIIENNIFIPHKDKTISQSIINLHKSKLIDIYIDKFDILTTSLEQIKQLYKDDKSDYNILDLIITLNLELIDLINNSKYNGEEVHRKYLYECIELVKIKKNLYPKEVEHSIEYMNLLINKLEIYIANKCSYAKKHELITIIMDNIKLMVQIICNESKIKFNKAYLVEVFCNIFMIENLELTLTEYILDEYNIYIEKQINLLTEKSFENLMEINNTICYQLIERISDCKGNLKKVIFEFSGKVIDMFLKSNYDNYIKATKGFWYLQNVFIDDLESKEKGYELYSESIDICTDKNEKNMFTKKMYLELAKFSLYRLENYDEAYKYCDEGIKIEDFSPLTSMDEELIEFKDIITSLENKLAQSC